MIDSASADPSLPDERHLDWEACWNARDLGGLPTGAGVTRRRSIIRADYLGNLTPAGRRALYDYGVRTVIDLRRWDELEDTPPPFRGERPDEPAFRHVPFERGDPAAKPRWKTIQTRFDVNRLFLDFYPRALAEVLAAIAAAPPGGVLFHCLGGTDRTGVVAAAVLRLAGVPDEVIADDYALTMARRQATYERLVAEKGEAALTFWERQNITADMMRQTLAYVDERYGGMEAYLLAAGLPAGDMARVRARLV